MIYSKLTLSCGIGCFKIAYWKLLVLKAVCSKWAKDVCIFFTNIPILLLPMALLFYLFFFGFMQECLWKLVCSLFLISCIWMHVMLRKSAWKARWQLFYKSWVIFKIVVAPGFDVLRLTPCKSKPEASWECYMSSNKAWQCHQQSFFRVHSLLQGMPTF